LDPEKEALLGNHRKNDPPELTLCSVQTLSLGYTLLPVAQSGLKYSGGAVGSAVAEAETGAGRPVLATMAPGTIFQGAALFIDSNQMALQPRAETETSWWWGE
jgi:hypothetical protein